MRERGTAGLKGGCGAEERRVKSLWQSRPGFCTAMEEAGMVVGRASLGRCRAVGLSGMSRRRGVKRVMSRIAIASSSRCGQPERMLLICRYQPASRAQQSHRK